MSHKLFSYLLLNAIRFTLVEKPLTGKTFPNLWIENIKKGFEQPWEQMTHNSVDSLTKSYIEFTSLTVFRVSQRLGFVSSQAIEVFLILTGLTNHRCVFIGLVNL